ncbi:MAG: HAD-IIB family hydrolase [Candidatus Aegiribacteria sp.]|nr:HAD-IIB family hydrolase [Candidatus Aegiribacteria sp.]MBD3295035.1 HAD-IIB family hydrolase [Candidatus Fermentibacteria bacterium]
MNNSFNMENEHPPFGIFATDMDGTLLPPGRDFQEKDIKALEHLGSIGVVRVIATGRSPFSFMRMMGKKRLPVDYLVLSSGAGIQDYRTGKYLRHWVMDAESSKKAVECLRKLDLDFCLQEEIPNNHAFTYWYCSRANPDLESRIALYSEHSRPMEENEVIGPSTQIVAVVPVERSGNVLEKVRLLLGDSHSVLRTTSPLDGESLWIEIFPKGVSKSQGVQWIASRYGLTGKDAAAVGNDYNDHDLLEWAADSYVVEDSPEHLVSSFTEVPSVYNGGVAEAVRRWLTGKGRLPEQGNRPSGIEW